MRLIVMSPRIDDNVRQISLRDSEFQLGRHRLHSCPFTRVPVTPIMEIFRTIVPPQKNGLHAGHLPANPLLTSLPRSRMMSAMSYRTTRMQPVLIVMNTTIVRRVVPG